jgi:hypothetical protein
MKIQTILSLAMATVALFASCSSDEILDVPVDKTIQFSGAFVDNSTRAATDPSYTTSTLDKFNVYGWVKGTAEDATLNQIFNEVEVSKTTSNGTTSWTYTDTQYWTEGASYTFDAIAGANGTIDIKDDANGAHASAPTITGFTSDGETDLIYATATATGKASNNPKVGFTFQHQLAKVKFTILDGISSTSAKIKVTDIKITNAVKQADVALSNTQSSIAWSNTSETVELDFGAVGSTYIDKSTATSESNRESANEKLLIPTTSTEYTIQLVEEIYQGDVLINTLTRQAKLTPSLSAGYAYNFTATLTEEPIEFTLTSVTGWTSEDNITFPATGASFTTVTE